MRSVRILPAALGISMAFALSAWSAAPLAVVTVPLEVDGAFASVLMDTPDDVAVFEFRGQAGQRLGLELQKGLVLVDGTLRVAIGGGGQFTQGLPSFSWPLGQRFAAAAFVLPASGTYRATVSNGGGGAGFNGDVRAALRSPVLADLPASTAPTGEGALNNVYLMPGQAGIYSFAGGRDDPVVLEIVRQVLPDDSLGALRVEVLERGASAVVASGTLPAAAGNRLVLSLLLPRAGDYQVLVRPRTPTTYNRGGIFAVRRAPVEGRLVPGRPAIAVDLFAGQSALLRIAGGDGQRYTLFVVKARVGSDGRLRVSHLSPSGQVLNSVVIPAGSRQGTLVVKPQSGNDRILVTPATETQAFAGRITLRLA